MLGVQSLILLLLLTMVFLTLFFMPDHPDLYSYLAWFKHSLFVVYWVVNAQIKRRFPFYAGKVFQRLMEYEEISGLRFDVDFAKREILVFHGGAEKKEIVGESLDERSIESNKTLDNLRNYDFVSDQENDQGLGNDRKGEDSFGIDKVKFFIL